jgi:hypothetical protein
MCCTLGRQLLSVVDTWGTKCCQPAAVPFQREICGLRLFGLQAVAREMDRFLQYSNVSANSLESSHPLLTSLDCIESFNSIVL